VSGVGSSGLARLVVPGSEVSGACRCRGEPRGLLAAKDPETIENLVATTRVIEESPALLAREQRMRLETYRHGV
jgi:hypothetical protein